MSSIHKSDNFEKIIPYFRIKPENNTNSAVIKYIGSMGENEKIYDTIIELDKPIHPDYQSVGRHAIPIKKYDKFDITGGLFRCNIVGTHIVMSSRYPLIYLNVLYDRLIVSGTLFQIFFSIDMDKNEKKAIKNNRQYLNLRFSGKLVRHIDCDDELKKNYEKLLKEMLEGEAAELLLDETLDNEFMNKVDEYINTERKYYDQIMTEQNMEFKSITQLRDNLVELCTSDRFYKFVKIAMKCRHMHRREQFGLSDMDEYVIPTNVTKLNDIVDEMIRSGEFILDDDND